MPDSNAVHVYHARPECWARAELLRGFALLDPAEREQSKRFLREVDRNSYVVAHALLRWALARHAAAVAPEHFVFAVKEARGKPEVAGPEFARHLRFSLSHTEGLVGCAIVSGREVGFDLEPSDRRAPLDIAPRYFAPSECAALRVSPEAQRNELFFRYWTLKEAYVKALGLGLSAPLQEFAFELSAEGAVRFDPGPEGDASRWGFKSWPIEPRHCAALALETNSDFDLRVVGLQAGLHAA